MKGPTLERLGKGVFCMKKERRVIYTILIIVILIPLVKPIGLPLGITEEVQRAYDTIEALEEGSFVILSPDYSAGASPELWPQTLAYTEHLMRKNARIIALSWWAEGIVFAERAMKECAERHGYQYGIDYVVLPFTAGGETAVAALGKNLKGLYTNDYYGTPIDEIPLMKDITGINDVSLIVSFGTGDDVVYYLKQIQGRYKVPVVAGVTAVIYPMYVPYLQSEQLSGLLGGLKGAAEYEKLLNQPGKALAGMDAQSLAHVYVILLILIGNIRYFTRSKSEKKGSESHG